MVFLGKQFLLTYSHFCCRMYSL